MGRSASRSQKAEELEQAEQAAFRERQLQLVADLSDAIYASSPNGIVSAETIKSAASRPQVLEIMSSIDLPVGFSLNDLHTMLDKEGEGDVPKADFLTGMRRFILSNQLQRQIILNLSIAQQRRKLSQLRSELVQTLEFQFASVNRRLDELVSTAGREPPTLAHLPEPRSSTPMQQALASPPPGPKILGAPGAAIQPDALGEPIVSQAGFPHFDHLIQVEENMLENVMALHHKLDALHANADMQGRAMMSNGQEVDSTQYVAALAENVLALDKKFDNLDLWERFATMQDNISDVTNSLNVVNDNMRQMSSTLQAQALAKPQAPSATIASSDHGPYTISVTGASLIIQTPTRPMFANPGHKQEHSSTKQPLTLPGAIGDPEWSGSDGEKVHGIRSRQRPSSAAGRTATSSNLRA